MILSHRGHTPRIDPTATVATTAVVSGNVTIGSGARVLDGAIVTSEDGAITIGADVIIMENALVKARAGHDVTIGDATLIIHNAPFDIGFLNFELDRLKLPKVINKVIDTVEVARQRHPGARVSLDALCKHYGIDNSRRTKHGALLDAEILAEVYVELIGARQAQLGLAEFSERGPSGADDAMVVRTRPQPLAPRLSEAEIAAHRDFVAGLGENALWGHYQPAGI